MRLFIIVVTACLTIMFPMWCLLIIPGGLLALAFWNEHADDNK